MNKPKFNIDTHAYWLFCEGQQVEVDGQKIQLTIVEEAKKTIDLHTDSWGVLNDGSQRFKDTVVKWLKENKDSVLTGELYGHFYGVDTSVEDNSWKGKDKFTHILTLDEFCALAYPEKEEGSELVGKWIRYKKEGFDLYNKWYEVKTVNPAQIIYGNSVNVLTIGDKKEPFGDACFDLANPLDYNPETLIGKYHKGAKIEKIELCPITDKAVFVYTSGVSIYCSDITPSEVTDTPPVKSLKYEDCFERVEPNWYVTSYLNAFESIRYSKKCLPTERQAKQLAATIKLMTIMTDANDGWIPKVGEMRVLLECDQERNKILFDTHKITLNSSIYFRDKETAQRAYEENKEVFHDYFGIGGENE